MLRSADQLYKPLSWSYTFFYALDPASSTPLPRWTPFALWTRLAVISAELQLYRTYTVISLLPLKIRTCAPFLHTQIVDKYNAQALVPEKDTSRKASEELGGKRHDLRASWRLGMKGIKESSVDPKLPIYIVILHSPQGWNGVLWWNEVEVPSKCTDTAVGSDLNGRQRCAMSYSRRCCLL
jgi:hypothetical protein